MSQWLETSSGDRGTRFDFIALEEKEGSLSKQQKRRRSRAPEWISSSSLITPMSFDLDLLFFTKLLFLISKCIAFKLTLLIFLYWLPSVSLLAQMSQWSFREDYCSLFSQELLDSMKKEAPIERQHSWVDTTTKWCLTFLWFSKFSMFLGAFCFQFQFQFTLEHTFPWRFHVRTRTLIFLVIVGSGSSSSTQIQLAVSLSKASLIWPCLQMSKYLLG